MAEKKDQRKQEQDFELVRILGKDIIGSTKVFAGLTKIKGISWAIANAICKILKLDKKMQIGDLSDEDIKKIEDFMKNPEFPDFIKNRQKDFDNGEDLHYYGSDLSLKNEFDIKRLKKIKSYKGIRHTAKLPVRGQRTKSNFRPNKGKSGGIKKPVKKE
jgi:small subunit ribosomal protein S13